MIDKTAPIGVFDSGIGGLTVVREIINTLPMENIVYFGDTARVPYGNKSKNTVLRYSRQIVRFLRTKDVKAIVIACNTASALALDELKAELYIPIIGVVWPGAKAAVEATRNRRIGVIATQSTVQSGLYQKLINDFFPDIKVYEKACPLFVPLVEEGWMDDPVTLEVAKRYISSLQDEDIDTLILGCTHYPLLYGMLSRYLGDKITLVNPAYETAKSLKEALVKLEISNENTRAGRRRFYFSDAIDKHVSFVQSILSCEIENAGQISIEDF